MYIVAIKPTGHTGFKRDGVSDPAWSINSSGVRTSLLMQIHDKSSSEGLLESLKQVNLLAKQAPWSLRIFDHSRFWQLRFPGVFLQSAPATGACFSRHLWCSASDLAISVAPLTTLVMGAVDQNRAGTASGINNVRPSCRLLTIAVLGVAMVTAFSF